MKPYVPSFVAPRVKLLLVLGCLALVGCDLQYLPQVDTQRQFIFHWYNTKVDGKPLRNHAVISAVNGKSDCRGCLLLIGEDPSPKAKYVTPVKEGVAIEDAMRQGKVYPMGSVVYAKSNGEMVVLKDKFELSGDWDDIKDKIDRVIDWHIKKIADQ